MATPANRLRGDDFFSDIPDAPKASDNLPDSLVQGILKNESGGQHYDAQGRVKLGPVTRSGSRAIGKFQVMPDVPGGRTRTIGGQTFDLYDEAQNDAAGRAYLSEGLKAAGGDEKGAALYYFGGPGALRRYQRSGRIPQGDDLHTTMKAYVQNATGGQAQKQPSDDFFSDVPDAPKKADDFFSDIPDSPAAATPPNQGEVTSGSPTIPSRGTTQSPATFKGVRKGAQGSTDLPVAIPGMSPEEGKAYVSASLQAGDMNAALKRALQSAPPERRPFDFARPSGRFRFGGPQSILNTTPEERRALNPVPATAQALGGAPIVDYAARRAQIQSQVESDIDRRANVRGDDYSAALNMSPALREQEVSSEVNRVAAQQSEQTARDQQTERMLTPDDRAEIERRAKAGATTSYLTRSVLNPFFNAVGANGDEVAAGLARVAEDMSQTDRLIEGGDPHAISNHFRKSAYMVRKSVEKADELSPMSATQKALATGADLVGNVALMEAAAKLGGSRAAFGGVGFLSSKGRGESYPEALGEGIKQEAIRNVFEHTATMPLAQRAATVYAATVAIEKASGATDEQAVKSAATNAGFVGLPEAAGRAAEFVANPRAEIQRGIESDLRSGQPTETISQPVNVKARERGVSSAQEANALVGAEEKAGGASLSGTGEVVSPVSEGDEAPPANHELQPRRKINVVTGTKGQFRKETATERDARRAQVALSENKAAAISGGGIEAEGVNRAAPPITSIPRDEQTIPAIRMKVSDIKDAVQNHLEGLFDRGEVDVRDIAVIGSHAKGTAKPGSDLDVLVEYGSAEDVREDGVFNHANSDENALYLNGVKVDINPVRADDSGTLDEWLSRHDYAKEAAGGETGASETGGLEGQEVAGRQAEVEQPGAGAKIFPENQKGTTEEKGGFSDLARTARNVRAAQEQFFRDRGVEGLKAAAELSDAEKSRLQGEWSRVKDEYMARQEAAGTPREVSRVPSESEAGAGERQPHEMTLDEYSAARAQETQEANLELRRQEERLTQLRGIRERFGANDDINQQIIETKHRIEELNRRTSIEYISGEHARLVEEARRAGLPVSEEVIASNKNVKPQSVESSGTLVKGEEGAKSDNTARVIQYLKDPDINGRASLEDIAEDLGLTTDEATSAVLGAEMSGELRQLPGRRFELTSAPSTTEPSGVPMRKPDNLSLTNSDLDLARLERDANIKTPLRLSKNHDAGKFHILPSGRVGTKFTEAEESRLAEALRRQGFTATKRTSDSNFNEKTLSVGGGWRIHGTWGDRYAVTRAEATKPWGEATPGDLVGNETVGVRKVVARGVTRKSEAEQMASDAGGMVSLDGPRRWAVLGPTESPVVRGRAEPKQSIRAERPNPRTGLTKTQTDSLASDLEGYAERHLIGTENYPKVESKQEGAELLAGVARAAKREPIARDFGKTETIKVPDDGEFTVRNVEEANRLHQKITGEPIEGLPKPQGARALPLPQKSIRLSAREQEANTGIDAVVQAYGSAERAHDALSKVAAQLDADPEVAKQMGGDHARMDGIISELKGQVDAERDLKTARAEVTRLESEVKAAESKTRGRNTPALKALRGQASEARAKANDLEFYLGRRGERGSVDISFLKPLADKIRKALGRDIPELDPAFRLRGKREQQSEPSIRGRERGSVPEPQAERVPGTTSEDSARRASESVSAPEVGAQTSRQVDTERVSTQRPIRRASVPVEETAKQEEIEPEGAPATRLRSFPKSAEEAGRIRERSLPKTLEGAELPKGTDLTYEEKTNVRSGNVARERISRMGEDSATDWVLAGEKPSVEQSATAVELIKNFANSGDAAKLERAVTIADEMSRKATEAGQFNQYFATLAKESPEGAVMAAQRAATRRGGKLTSEQAQDFVDTATRLQKAEAKNAEHEKAIADLQKQLTSAKPQTFRQRGKLETLADRFSKREAEARARIAETKRRMAAGELDFRNTGPVPGEISAHWKDYVTIGAAKLARKAVRFADWADDMVKDFGEKIRPYLDGIYKDSYKLYSDEKANFERERQERGVRRENKGTLKPEDIERLIIERRAKQRQSRMEASSARADLQRKWREVSRTGGQRALAKTGQILSTVNRNALLVARGAVRILGGMSGKQAADTVGDMIAAPIDATLSKVRGTPRGTSRLTVPGLTRASINGAYEGTQNALRALRGKETQFSRAEEPVTGMKPVDAGINLMQRLYSAKETLLRSYAYNKSIETQARTFALNDLKEGKITRSELSKRTQDYKNNPPPLGALNAVIAAERAATQADYDTKMHRLDGLTTPAREAKFKEDLDALMNSVALRESDEQVYAEPSEIADRMRGTRRAPPTTTTGKTLQVTSDVARNLYMPFMRRPSNALVDFFQTYVGAPLNVPAQGIRMMLDGKSSEAQVRFSKAVGRGLAGYAIMGLGAELASQGRMTGMYNADEKKRGSLIINGKAYGVWKIPFVGWLLTLGATVHESGLKTAPGAMTQMILEHPFLRGIKEAGSSLEDLANAARSGDKMGAAVGKEAVKVGGQFASRLVPQPLPVLAEATDTKERVTNENIYQPTISRIPWARQTLLQPFADKSPTSIIDPFYSQPPQPKASRGGGSFSRPARPNRKEQ